jgi:homoaconitase/3-isopropylmalate dehydratase large subunit
MGAEEAAEPMGMTIAEKILAAHAGRSSVRPGEYVWCKVDATSGHMLGALERLGVEQVWDPDRVYVVEDHLAPPPTVEAANAVADAGGFMPFFTERLRSAGLIGTTSGE